MNNNRIKTLAFTALCLTAASALGTPVKNSPLFVPNRGQWNKEAKFLARFNGLDLWVTGEGAVFDLHRDSKSGQIVKMEFVGGKKAEFRGAKPQTTRENYFIGNRRANWHTNVPTYAEATSSDIYKGIHARYYLDKGLPRYDLIIEPGADPNQIAMSFKGVNGVSAQNGSLSLKTTIGPLLEKDLVVYQEVSGKQKRVPARFAVSGNVARFQLGGYNRHKCLVIDPLVFNTFSGDPYGYNIVSKVSADANGNIFAAGWGANPQYFPRTQGAYSSGTNTSNKQLFISKFGPDGTLLWSSEFGGTTYPAGSYGDGLGGLAVDASGNPIICGLTSSPDYPTTPGSYQSTANGLPSSTGYASIGVISKLSADGTQLLASTYLGTASAGMTLNGCALNSNGMLYIIGNCNSGLPTTPGSFRPNAASSGQYMGYVAAMPETLDHLNFGTYLYGSKPSNATGTTATQGIALDSNSNVCVSGFTDAPDYPITNNALQTTRQTIYATGFVSVLSADGSALNYSTYFGGNGVLANLHIAVDGANEICLAGNGVSVPATAGAFQTSGGAAFVAKIYPSGALRFCSYLGMSDEMVNGIRTDGAGNILVVGTTSATNFPVTPGAFELYPWLQNQLKDGFLSEINASGTRLIYSTYLGGPVAPIAVAANDVAVVSGTANVVVAGDTGYNMGKGTVFVVKLNMVPQTSLVIPSNTVHTGTHQYVTVTVPQPAPAGGLTLPLSSSNPNVASVPSSVTIPEGRYAATFLLEAPPGGGETNLSVQGPDATFTAPFVVLLPRVVSMNISPSSVNGGSTLNTTVQLDSPAGNNFNFQIQSTGALIPTGFGVTFPYGASSATFQVPVHRVMMDTNATASIGSSYGTFSAPFTVLAPRMSAIAFTSSGFQGTSHVTGTVTLNNNTEYATSVSLATSDPSVTSSSVVVGGGGIAAQFSLTSSSVSVDTNVTITASLNGVSKSGTVVIYATPAPQAPSVTFNPTSMIGSQGATGTVNLGYNAPNDVTVTLVSKDPAVAVPSQITIPMGSSSNTFSVTTSAVDYNRSVNVTATARGKSGFGTLTVQRAALFQFTVGSNTLSSGGTTTGTVTLNGPAGPAGRTISLYTNSTAIGVPKTLTFAPGATTEQFTLTAGTVTKSTPVTISASSAGVVLNQTVTVSP